MDEGRLKESFAAIAAYGDEIALFFYSHLFLGHPELRGMFPVSMAGQRDRLLSALGKIVAEVSNHEDLVPFLQGLARDHRKFGTLAGHYPAVGESLLATLAHFSGAGWTQDLANDWTEAYGLIAAVMTTAAAEDETRNNPAWWDAVIVGHERRSLDVSVLRVAPRLPLPYLPGQSVAVECEQRPRLWRFYSPANAPRGDNTIDFHVRLVDGGAVSSALVRGVAVGARLRLGAPVGSLTLSGAPGRDLLLAAGSTGLAPLKAIIEHAATLPAPPRTCLVFGARTARELYDLAALEKMAAQWPWLTVTPAVSAEPADRGHSHTGPSGTSGTSHSGGAIEQGTVADVVARLARAPAHDVYVCGSAAMVAATVSRLESVGMPREQIHFEDFAWSRT